MSINSDLYLDKWSRFARKDIDWLNNGPRPMFDTKKRVRRETVRGKTTIFHQNMEDYLERQLRTYTLPRGILHTTCLLTFALKYYFIVQDKFSDNWRYKTIFHNPVYKKLGFGWTAIYYLRPLFFAYLTGRAAIYTYNLGKKRWNGDLHFIYEIIQDQNYYDTWYKDIMDYKMVNFRYSDHRDFKTSWNHFNHDIFKADADYYKDLYKFFKKGDDSYLEYFLNRNEKH